MRLIDFILKKDKIKQKIPYIIIRTQKTFKVTLLNLEMKLNFTSKGYFQHIDQFTPINQIGVGSFGKVQLSLHIETNKFYAIKIVELSQSNNQKEAMLLEREIYIHSNIDHPHIIKLWDVFSDQHNIYMVMELAQNSTLFSFQNKIKVFSQIQAFKYFNQTVKAIQYMHSLDIMHRDIKPQNILLDKNNNVKLCDLGWATDNITMKRKTFCGTYEYMAPEMIFEKDYNYKIDIWALGILLYELTHGFAPFQAKNLSQIRENISQGCYEMNENISDELRILIVDLLQFDPNQRPELSELRKYEWIQKMKKQIQVQLSKIKDNQKIHQQESITSSRIKQTVNRKQVNCESMNKKHKKIQSFDQFINNESVNRTNIQEIKNNLKGLKKVLENQHGQTLKKIKKKCKTQGQESIQKIYTQSVLKATKASKLLQNISINLKKKPQKQNINSSTTNFLKWSNIPEYTYTSSFTLKNQPKSIARVKKSNNNDINSKRQKNDKKNSRLKTINFF